MNKIYVLKFNDYECYCAYATKEAAKKVLWEYYCDKVLPNISDAYREACYTEDLQTFEESDYITEIGCVEEVTFVNE